MNLAPSAAYLPVRTVASVPWMEIPGVRAVVWALGAENVRFVGGCVRDLLCERPTTDVDIATVHPPEETLARLQGARVRVKPIGIEHGTVVAFTDTGRFEITTLRRDVATDGRHAVVAFTNDWAEDAARRDFSINAMSLSPEGHLYDPAGGIDDLAGGRVRFIGDPVERIREDVLRILRFFRFSAWYGTAAPDRAGLAACTESASLLPRLSGERISTELRKLFAAPNPYQVLLAMAENRILSSLTDMELAPQRLSRLVAIEQANSIEPMPLCRLALSLPGNREQYSTFAKHLRFSKTESARLVRLARPLPDLGDDKLGIRHALYREKDREIYTFQTLIAAAEGDRVDMRSRLHEAASWAWPVFPVNGFDLIEMGVPPGPNVGALLVRLEEWWARQDFKPDRAECLRTLQEAYDRSA